MLRTARPFFLTLLFTWLALLVAAIVYSKRLTHSQWIISAALPAFLVESAFYLGSIFTETRDWFGKLRPARLQALLLWVSALAPYLILSLAAGTFHRNAFLLLAALSGVFTFWHAILPRRLAYDIGFLAIAAAPFLTKVFARVYVGPDLRLHVDILGHLMWIRAGVIALLILREWDPGPFDFWPRAREWRIGTGAFAIAIVPLVGIALIVHDITYSAPSGPWWQTAGKGLAYFAGALWVIAVGEELFFRGVIERALLNGWKSPVLAIVVSSALYGAAHLWLHAFPNWPHVAVTFILGLACGVAYLRAGSIRASMVTHAFAVAAWRLFFK